MPLTSEQRDFILAHEREDVLATALRFARDDMPLLLAQIAGRQAAEKKIPSWHAHPGIYYPPHLSLQQASSELTASYKAALTETLLTPAARQTGALADLTGGMGVDFSFMARRFRQAMYVERNEELCRIARHNFGVLGLTNATVHCAGAERFLQQTPPLELIYLDPSRRDDAGKKLVRIEDCSPGVQEILPLLLQKAGAVMLKYSPMLDISSAVQSLACVTAVHIVAVENECRELLFLLSTATGEACPPYSAVNLTRPGGAELFTFTMEQEKEAAAALADAPRRYLYEPHAAILKAGAFKAVAQAYALCKLHVNSHLYTSDRLVENFPGRIFEVETCFAPNGKNVRAFLRETKKANVTVRNFPATVAEIRRKTGLEDGGDTYLFATTLANEQKAWIKCRKAR
jgi:16S rRNA G966 N2-methylase RsmD